MNGVISENVLLTLTVKAGIGIKRKTMTKKYYFYFCIMPSYTTCKCSIHGVPINNALSVYEYPINNE